ncbi:MAG: hypothetical protein JJE35_09750 [Thermoleophilia bacterium]|nr:hypothetical protein [Thermoleophilia bacterium]
MEGNLLRQAIVGIVALALASAAWGCGGSSEPTASSGKDRQAPSASDQKPRPRTVAPSHCPDGVPDCATTEGEILYVERVDPDGDGDAHFVVIDSQSITLPGLTAIDVRKGLRPHPLPGPGDLISAAGPVQTGSYGQSQIHALEIHVAGGG